MTAIYNALLALNQQKTGMSTIFSDSLSALECIKSFKPVHPLAIKIKQAVHMLSLKNHYVSFCWCPSHIGIKGNEEADSLAKSAATRTASFLNKTYHKYYKRIFRISLYKKWQQEWSTHINNITKHDVLELIKPEIELWPSSYSSSRLEEVILCRLRLGHTRITHGYLMSQTNRTMCDLCHIPISMPHILIDCPKFSLPRKIFGTNPTLKSILCEDKINKQNLLKFLKDLNLLNSI